MIKLQTYDMPIIHQLDNSYSLPAFTGTVQWNGALKKFQVSTGTGWQDIDNNISYSVDRTVITIIEWAKKKMEEEQELEALAKSNSTIADLVHSMEDIKEQIEVVKTIIKYESN